MEFDCFENFATDGIAGPEMALERVEGARMAPIPPNIGVNASKSGGGGPTARRSVLI